MKFLLSLYPGGQNHGSFFYPPADSLFSPFNRHPLMGKREIGQLSSIDFVVAIVVAELATLPITDIDFPLLQSLVPIALLTVLQVITSLLCLKSNNFRQFLYGKPNILICQGRLQIAEMRKARYNIDDLLTQLRQRDVFDISEVAYAVLETSGDLTVILKPAKRPVTRGDLGFAPASRAYAPYINHRRCDQQKGLR